MATNRQAAKKKPAASKSRAGKKPVTKAAVRKPARKSGTKKGATAKAKAAPREKTAAQPRPESAMLRALRAEHRHIATVMQLFLDQLESVEAGDLVDTHIVYEVLDYMVSWPDRFHHPREDLVYGRVAEIDGNVADSVDSLQRDHDRTAASGRELRDMIERWREGEVSGSALVKSGRAYVDHMYEHMNIEENQVFPQINAVLSAEDWRELEGDDQLQPVADPIFGPRVQREYRNLARKLRRNVRRGVERGTMIEWVGLEALMESLEVLSMAYEAARGSTGDHLKQAVDESLELLKEAPLMAPLRCTANNARLGMHLLEAVASISRDALNDLSRVNQARKDRIRLLD